MISVSPTLPDGTRPAESRTPRCFISAHRTDFLISGWARKFSAMLYFVTRNTKRYTVRYIKSALWMSSKSFYMMRVQRYTFLSALLTGIIVSGINRLSPCAQFSFEHSALSSGRFPAFVISSLFSNPKHAAAMERAKLSVFIFAREYLSASRAFFGGGWITHRPTTAGAIIGFFGAVELYFVNLSATVTSFFNSIISHAVNYIILW